MSTETNTPQTQQELQYSHQGKFQIGAEGAQSFNNSASTVFKLVRCPSRPNLMTVRCLAFDVIIHILIPLINPILLFVFVTLSNQCR